MSYQFSRGNFLTGDVIVSGYIIRTNHIKTCKIDKSQKIHIKWPRNLPQCGIHVLSPKIFKLKSAPYHKGHISCTQQSPADQTLHPALPWLILTWWLKLCQNSLGLVSIDTGRPRKIGLEWPRMPTFDISAGKFPLLKICSLWTSFLVYYQCVQCVPTDPTETHQSWLQHINQQPKCGVPASRWLATILPRL